mmetsp:Transcript_4522/g.17108  ORF Transcript_4522/g.17108 Transcript_4522/m.17108 type:complete len:1210 (-) Transcript_4522:479-4108(-)
MGRKKSKNTFANDMLPDFDELEDMPPQEEQPVEEDQDESLQTQQKAKKGSNKKANKKAGKKNKKNNDDDLLPELDELDQDDENPQWDDDESEEAPQTKKAGKKNKKGASKKGGKKGKTAQDDFLPELDELEQEHMQLEQDDDDQSEERISTTKPSKKDKKGKKGGKKSKKGSDSFLPDLDMLDEDDDDTQSTHTTDSASKTSSKKKNKTKEDLLKEVGADAGDAPKQLTKKELKRLKKEQAKQKEKEQKKKKQQQEEKQGKKDNKKKENKKEEKADETPSTAAKSSKKPPKKLNARLLAIKQAQEEKMRREREIQDQLDREEQERLEVERLLQEKRDEEKRQREEQKRKEEEEIAEQKRLGIYMTEAQRAKAEKQRQQMIAMLKRQGKEHLIDQLLNNTDRDVSELQGKKKHLIDFNKKKKKKGGKKGGAKKGASKDEGTPAEAQQQKEAAPKQQDKKEQKKGKTIGSLTSIAEPGAEEASPKMAAKADAKKKEESDDELDNWEDMSLSSGGEEEEEPQKAKDADKKKAAPIAQKIEKPVEETKPAPAPQKAEEAKKATPAEKEDSDDEWDATSSDEEEQQQAQKAQKMSKFQKSQLKKQRELLQREEEEQQNAGEHFRNPICCVLGHVDTGKTKILDKIRSTNVQSGEAGGITQQIGATYIPAEAIETQTSKLGESRKIDLKVPGLLIIDTPGHESFTNLRSRGTSLCDIAILVVDVLHGLERQTLESIELLRKRKCPFVVALNKIDTIYGWKPQPNAPSRDTLKKQSKHTKQLFDQKVAETITLFAEQGLNACLYYKNKDFKKYVSLVPTSAITGEGIPDLLMLMCVLTQNLMASKITYKNSFECTVLEVKVVEGHGHTVDVILSNGILRESDTIVLCGLNGPIVTKIRALLTPKPLKEIRVKGEYMHHKEIKASMGIKIAAQNLDQAVPGTQLLVVRPDDDIEDLKEKVMEDFADIMSRISTTGRGVYVASSTLGSLEALLSFLKDAKIPVAHISIGPVHKRDVTVCSSMKEKAPEYAIILAFDVPITKDAQELADKEEIKIFAANIIYHLFDRFTEHQERIKEERKQANAKNAVWPCILSQTGDVFHSRDPITLGIHIDKGELRVGTPCVAINAKGEKVDLGIVTGIQHEKKARQVAKEGEAVAVSFDSGHIQHGRHMGGKDVIVSKLHRGSIEAIKEGFKEELMANNQYFLRTIVEVKKILGLQ